MVFENMPSSDSNKLFKKSFGNLNDQTCYSDPMGVRGRAGLKVDLKSIQDTGALHAELKAITTDQGGAGSTDQTLVPLYLDNKIVDQSRVQTPISAMIPRVTNRGITAEFNVITSKQFSSGTYNAAFYAESDIGDPGTGPVSRDSTPSRESVPIKYMRVIGQVTGPAQAAIPSFSIDGLNPQGGDFNSGYSTGTQASNAYSFDVLTATRSLKEAEEWATINGSISSNSNQYNGIIQTMGSTNTIAKSNSKITLSDIDEAARLAFEDGGLPEFAFTDTKTYNEIKSLLQQAYQGFNFEETGVYGFTYLKFHTMGRTVKIIASRFLTTTDNSRALYMLDMSVWETRVLQDMTMERLAKVDDHERFMIKQYLTLICRAPMFNASITGIGVTN